MKKILLGKVVAPFGIKGEVKILSFCKNPVDIEKYKLFDRDNNKVELKIKNKSQSAIKYNSSGGAILLAKISGVEDRNKSEEMRNYEIFANREDFSDLSQDEFYHVDLVGLDVVDDAEKKIGKVINVLDFGAGVMLEIDFGKENPQLGLEKIENFPFKNAIFPDVNIKAGFVKMTLPEVVKIK